MADEAEIEIARRVHFDRAYVEVCVNADNPTWLSLRTIGKHNEDYFGKLDFPMHPNFALQLGNALVAAAKEKGAC